MFASWRAASAQQGSARPSPVQEPAKITGRVLRAEGGMVLAKAVVTMLPEGRPNETIAVRTGSDGVFEFSAVPPGRYRLMAEKNGYVRLVYGQRGGGSGVKVNVEPGAQIEKLEFRLERSAAISGRVADEDYDPVEGIEVRAQRVRFLPGGVQRVLTVRAARTDDLGGFRLSGLAPGYYYVQAGGRGEGVSIGAPALPLGYPATYYPGVALREESRRVQVSAGIETRGIDIQVRASPTFAVTGVILDAATSGSPKRYSIGFAREGAIAMRSVDRDDGTFMLRGLEPGEYTLVAAVSDESGGLRRGYRTVSVADADTRVVIEIGRTAELRGEVHAPKALSFAGLYVDLTAGQENGVGASAAIDPKGHFRISNVPEGRYFIQLSGHEQEVYLREVRCKGEDFTARPIGLGSGETVDDCIVTLGTDVAQVSGRVVKEDRPVAGFVVVLIPVEAQRRRIARHTSVGQTDANGRFLIRGVVPLDYFVFSVPPTDDAGYYDLEFANRNRESSTLLTVEPRESYKVELKPTQPR